MVVTGGTDALGQDLEDVWSLNLRTMQWTQLQDAPFGARQYVSAQRQVICSLKVHEASAAA